MRKHGSARAVMLILRRLLQLRELVVRRATPAGEKCCANLSQLGDKMSSESDHTQRKHHTVVKSITDDSFAVLARCNWRSVEPSTWRKWRETGLSNEGTLPRLPWCWDILFSHQTCKGTVQGHRDLLVIVKSYAGHWGCYLSQLSFFFLHGKLTS